MELIVEPDRSAAHIVREHTLDKRLSKTDFNWAEERHRDLHGSYVQCENGASGSDVRPGEIRPICKGELSKDRMCDAINSQ